MTKSRMTNDKVKRALRHSSLVFDSSFEFRHSSFRRPIPDLPQGLTELLRHLHVLASQVLRLPRVRSEIVDLPTVLRIRVGPRNELPRPLADCRHDPAPLFHERLTTRLLLAQQ